MTDRSSPHEQSDLSLFGVLLSGLGTFAALALLSWAVWLYYQDSPGTVVLQPQNRVSEYRSFQYQPAEMQKKQEQKILSSYSWSNRAQGRVRIPISAAIQRRVATRSP
jgi:hypothetical protein